MKEKFGKGKKAPAALAGRLAAWKKEGQQRAKLALTVIDGLMRGK